MTEEIATLRTEDRRRHWTTFGLVAALTLSSSALMSQRALFSPFADPTEMTQFAPVANAMLVPVGGSRHASHRASRGNAHPTAFAVIPQQGADVNPVESFPTIGLTPSASTGPLSFDGDKAPQVTTLSLPGSSTPDVGGSLPGPGGSLPGGGGGSSGGPVIPPVTAVPEPASWAMIIIGFGFIGGLLRRQRAMGRALRLA